MNTKFFIPVTAGMLALAALGSGLRWRGEGAMAEKNDIVLSASAPIVPVLGLQRRFALELSTQLEQASADAHRPRTALRVSGEWVTTVTDKTADSYQVACELQQAQVTGSGLAPVEADSIALLERRLSRRFWVTYTLDGAATRLHFPQDVAEDVRNYLTLIVTQSQLVRSKAGVPLWSSTERDGGGTYLASYRQLSDTALTKQKLGYLPAAAAGADPTIRLTIAQSELRYELDSSGELATLDGHENTLMGVDTNSPGLKLDLRVKLQRPRRAPAPELVGAFERARPSLHSLPIVTHSVSRTERQARADAVRARGVSLQAALDALGAKPQDPDALSSLEAVLRSRDDDAARAAELVRRGKQRSVEPLLNALGAAGSPAAQLALLSLAEDQKLATQLRVSALAAVARTNAPTEATIASLLKLLNAQDVMLREQAIYAAGTLASRADTIAPGSGGLIAARLLSLYDACTGAECERLLGGLGNLALPEVLPRIQRSLLAEEPARRSAALRAVRLVRDPAVDPLLTEALLKDAAPQVRAAAIFAMTFRELAPFFEALKRVAGTDPTEYVRADALRALAAEREHNPAVEAVLAEAAKKDPSAGNRRLAAALLGSS